MLEVNLFHITFLLLFGQLTATVPIEGSKTTVLVVGAGTAGLAAGRMMIDNWPAGKVEVTVLEGRSRLGGRVWTVQSPLNGWPSPIGGEGDMGASWIHGSTGSHPITQIQAALDLTVFETDDDSAMVFDKNSQGVFEEVSNDRSEDCETLLEQAQEEFEPTPAVPDRSLWDSMDGLESGGQNRDSSLIQSCLSNGAEFNTAGSMKELSTLYWDADETFQGTEQVFKNGYVDILQSLAQGNVTLPNGVPVKKQGRALSIQYTKQVVKVLYDDQAASVLLQDGSVVKADYVIITVPLGVLKRGDVTFNPSLPSSLQTAITGIGFGNVHKIALLFDEAFWPKTTHYFTMAVPGEDRGLFTYYLNLVPATGKNVLMTFGLGADANDADSMTDEQAWQFIRPKLLKMFPTFKVPENYKGVMRSKWSKDPFAYGAYSFAKVGFTPSMIKEFRKSLSNRVYFAGEHTSEQYRGTVHGAFLSGVAAAEKVYGPKVEVDVWSNSERLTVFNVMVMVMSMVVALGTSFISQ